MTHGDNEAHTVPSIDGEKKRKRLSHAQSGQLLDYIITGYTHEHKHLPLVEDVLDSLNSLARPEAPFTRGFINNYLKTKGHGGDEGIREIARTSGIYEAMIINGELHSDFTDEVRHTVPIPEKIEIEDRSTSELIRLMARIATELVNRDGVN